MTTIESKLKEIDEALISLEASQIITDEDIKRWEAKGIQKVIEFYRAKAERAHRDNRLSAYRKYTSRVAEIEENFKDELK